MFRTFHPKVLFVRQAETFREPKETRSSVDVDVRATTAIISIAWDNVHRKQLKHLVKEIQRSDTDSVPNFAWQLALRESENLVVSPVAWSKLSETAKTTIVNFFQATIFERWVPWIDVYLNDHFHNDQEHTEQTKPWESPNV